MNCAEFQRVLPGMLEGGSNAEQERHLHSCPECSELVSDLNAISQQAKRLRACEEPSPRVWNSIEMALRQEGLIGQPQREPFLVSARPRRWRMAWLAPVTAAVLAVLGVMVYERGAQRQAEQQPTARENAPASLAANINLASVSDDQQLLEMVGTRSPALRADYESNLQNVNAYIRDAEESAKANPNDEEAQQSLMDAYQQRTMVYAMALDRSLP